MVTGKFPTETQRKVWISQSRTICRPHGQGGSGIDGVSGWNRVVRPVMEVFSGLFLVRSSLGLYISLFSSFIRRVLACLSLRQWSLACTGNQ